MNEKNNKMKRFLSLLSAVILVISVLTVAMIGVSAEPEATSVEEDSEIAEDFDIEKLLGEMNRDPTEPVERLDVLDPELTQLLSGSDFSGEGLTATEGNELLTDPHTIDQHHVGDVHDMGIHGDGVQVSLMDTGFDMAHPDIAGTHAVFEYDEDTMDPEMEMYDGYPIAFDPVSMADYAYDGNISQDYESWWGTIDNSWYVDTTYENTTYENDTEVIVANFTEKEEDVTYTMPDGIEAGELVRFGLHPDDKLNTWYGERPAVLLTQDDEGNWTNIYVDLLNDREFVEESGAWIDGEDPMSELITRDLNGDGIADVSGGMLYFASDGEMPIPYSQHFRETMNKMINLAMGYPPGTIGEEMEDYEDAWHFMTEQEEIYTTPDDGEMIALMGDFNDFGSYGAHGTWTASAVAGQGVTGVPEEDILEEADVEESPYPPTPEGGEGLPRGLSPNATIIPMGRFFDPLPADNPLGEVPTTYSSIFFTADGYTGDPEITCDSADIASSSFGITVWENHGGFNFYERLFDYVGTQYTQNTLFINSQGNEGSGFGTVSAPSGAQGVLSVGATGNQLYRVDEWNMYDGGPNPWYGEVTGMTSTGPHSKGSHGPDIMTNGQFGYGGDPLNQQLDNIGDFQGNNSWTLWSGTSLSAPNAAGIAALVYQAYEEAHGEAPCSQTLKNLIMQGADDINNSPHLQGPGEANAYNSVRIAQGEGLYLEESQWRPGTNPEMDQHVEHHVNMMEAGEEQTDQLTLHNWNEEDEVDYEMGAYKQEKVGNTSIELESGPSGRVPLLAINETGVYELIYNETNDNWDLCDEPIAELDDPNADLFRFGTHTPYENQGMYDYSLAEFYNWEDVNDNGSFDGWEERNRIGSTDANIRALETYEFIDASPTSDYFTIHDALERAEDGIIVQMNNDLFGFGEPWVTSFEFTLNIEQYNQVEWDWIEFEDPTTGTINAGETLEYEITAIVPEDAIKGIYGGKLMIEDVNHSRTLPIPITITVGESTDLSEPMHFGAAEGEDDNGIYRNDRLYGSWEGGLTGDWRFYTFHLEEDTEGDIQLDLTFDDELSDMTGYLLGGAEHDVLDLGMTEDPFSDPIWDMQDRYGVNTLETIEETDIDEGDRVSFVGEPIEAGTYMIAVQSHQISGHEPYQEFSGELRELNISSKEPTIISSEKVTLHGEVTGFPMDVDEVNASFRYREEGAAEWTETENQTMEETGPFEETIDGLDDETTYEFQAMIQWNSEEIGREITFSPEEQPVEMILHLEEGDVVQGDSLVISGEIVEDHPVDNLESAHLEIDEWFELEQDEIGEPKVEFELPVVLAEMNHTYYMEVEDEEGNTNEFEITFTVDNTEPVLDITDFENDLEDDEATIYGETEEGAEVWIDGVEVTVEDDHTFEHTVILEEGENYIEIMAVDEAGNTAEKEITAAYIPQIQELEDEIDDLWTEIGSLEDDIAAIEDDIADIEGDIAEIEEDIGTLEDDISEIETDISEIEDDIADLEGDIDDIQDDISDIVDDIAAIEGDIADLEDDIAAIQSDIDELEDEQETQADDIGMARNLGIVGIILAILALIIAVVAMSSKKSHEEEPIYEEESEPSEEETVETEEEMFGEEEESELFEEEMVENEEEEIFEEPEETEEDIFEEESFEEESEEEL